MSTSIWTPDMLSELRRLKLEGNTNEQIATHFNTTPAAVKGKWSEVLRVDQARISAGTINKQVAAIDALASEINHRKETIAHQSAEIRALQASLAEAARIVETYPLCPLWRRIWGAIVGKLPAG